MRQLQNGKPAAQLLSPDAEDVQAEEEDAVIDVSDEQPETEAEAEPNARRVSRPKVFKNPDWVELAWNGTGKPTVQIP